MYIYAILNFHIIATQRMSVYYIAGVQVLYRNIEDDLQTIDQMYVKNWSSKN